MNDFDSLMDDIYNAVNERSRSFETEAEYESEKEIQIFRLIAVLEKMQEDSDQNVEDQKRFNRRQMFISVFSLIAAVIAAVAAVIALFLS